MKTLISSLSLILLCSSGVAQAQRTPWLRLAQELDLVVTGGSDFHGQGLPSIERPGIEMPSTYAEPLMRWLELG